MCLMCNLMSSGHGLFDAANSRSANGAGGGAGLPADFVTGGTRWTDSSGTSSGGTSGILGATGGVVAWSIAGAGLTNATGVGFYTGSSVDMGTFLPFDYQAVLRLAFNAWAAVANIEFIQVADGGGNIGVGTAPTIRIVGGFIDGQSGSNVLARAFFPSSNPAGGDVVFDSGNTTFFADSNSFFLTAIHEIGHTLGLNHEQINLAIMNPFINTALTGLQADDIAGIRAVYGNQDFGSNSYYMAAGQTTLTLIDDAPLNTIYGNSTANTITGNGENNTINGQGGNDILYGMGGNDTLIGGTGADSLYGGDGDDLIYWDAGDILANVQGGNGTDTLVVGNQSAPTGFDLTSHGFEAATQDLVDAGAAIWTTQHLEYNALWQTTFIRQYNDNNTRFDYTWDRNNLQTWNLDHSDYDSTGLRTVERLYNDDNSYRFFYWDRDNTHNWTTFDDEYNANNQRFVERLVYDDNSYRFFYWDVDSTHVWATFDDEYNSSGQRFRQRQQNDDGTRTDTAWDVSAQYGWQYKTDYYDVSGAFVVSHGLNDDGTTF